MINFEKKIIWFFFFFFFYVLAFSYDSFTLIEGFFHFSYWISMQNAPQSLRPATLTNFVLASSKPPWYLKSILDTSTDTTNPLGHLLTSREFLDSLHHLPVVLKPWRTSTNLIEVSNTIKTFSYISQPYRLSRPFTWHPNVLWVCSTCLSINYNIL